MAFESFAPNKSTSGTYGGFNSMWVEPSQSGNTDRSKELAFWAKNDPGFESAIASLTNKHSQRMRDHRSFYNKDSLDAVTSAQNDYLRQKGGIPNAPNAPTWQSPDYSGVGNAPAYSGAKGAESYLDYPEYDAPDRDEDRIRKLTAMNAAPGLRALRSQIQAAQNKTYRNPTMKRLTLRDALAGYGQGLESVLAGAKNAGLQEYDREYASEVDEYKTNYSSDISRRNQLYSTATEDAWKEYQSAYQTWNASREDARFNSEMKYKSDLAKYQSDLAKYQVQYG